MRFDNLTEEFRNLLEEAQVLAVERDHFFIEPWHIFFSLVRSKDSNSLTLLSQAGVDLKTLLEKTEVTLDQLPKSNERSGNIQLSRESIKFLSLSQKISQKFGNLFVSSEMFLLALLEGGGELASLLFSCGLNRFVLEEKIKHEVVTSQKQSKESVLAKYTIDLTEQAKMGKSDPVIGRDDEIRRTIQIIQRRTKNNPVLIGEPGVGKTAIVEGLAQRIVNKDLPAFCDKRLLAIDLAALLAGAKYRGEFEERFKTVIEEIIKHGDTIIFIDEIHTLVGAGKTDGALDASNMLKPALARGELHCIGATTINEYRRYIEKDAALERRFQKILINEPDKTAAIAILRGLQGKYELHHRVDITDPAIVAAVELSSRYITDRFLPDKAIDLIDEAAAQIKIEIDSKPESMDKLERRIIQLKIECEAMGKEKDEVSEKRLALLRKDIENLEKEYSGLEEIWKAEKSQIQISVNLRKEIEELRLKMTQLQRSGQLDKVARIQYGQLPELEKRLEDIEHSSEKQSFKLLRTQVGVDEIAKIVARATGIPVSKMVQSEKDKLLKIEDFLNKHIIGQHSAIDLVSNTIRRSRVGLADPNKPLGSFLFLGPTGVGKTELCKTLADFLFDSTASLIRFDMSEFMEKHSVAKLIGAPPGYIGYEEGGYLTEQVRRRPYSIVLLDEIEKAHADTFDLLLQVLDEGRMTDGQGHVVNFKNTIIVMTSNLGAYEIQRLIGEDFSVVEKAVLEKVKEYLKPELFNRIDEIIFFKSLQLNEIREITKIQLKKLAKRLNLQGIKFDISERALDEIVRLGFDPLYGARLIKRTIQRKIETPIANGILEGRFTPNSLIPIDFFDDQIVFSCTVH